MNIEQLVCEVVSAAGSEALSEGKLPPIWFGTRDRIDLYLHDPWHSPFLPLPSFKDGTPMLYKSHRVENINRITHYGHPLIGHRIHKALRSKLPKGIKMFDTDGCEVDNDPVETYRVTTVDGGVLALCGGCLVFRTPGPTVVKAQRLTLDEAPLGTRCECPSCPWMHPRVVPDEVPDNSGD